MTQKPEQPNNESKSEIAQSVMDRIASEQIAPKSRMYFQCITCYLWTAWLASIIVGAVAFSVMLYLSTHIGNAFYEATHETFIEFALEAMPIVWLIVFAAMAGLAYYNLRHTTKGHRYPLWQVLLSSLLLSIVGGTALHAFGFGHTVEMAMEKNMPIYRSYQMMEREWWTRPKDGLLVGHFVRYVDSPSVMQFVDMHDRQWALVADELPVREQLLLESEKMVKVIGVKSTTSEQVFHGCGVFPWMHAEPMGLAEMRKEKNEFLHKINDYKRKIKRRLETHLAATGTRLAPIEIADPMGVCAMMPVLRR